MRDKNKFVEDFIESKLRASSREKTPGDFTKHLMKRIAAENKALAEERKSERVVKYTIGTFSMFVIAFTVIIGVVSTAGRQNTGDETGVGFNSVQTSNSLIEQLLYYVQAFFINALNFLGLSLDSSSINIIMIVVLLVVVFLLGERLFLRGKLKQTIHMSRNT